MGIISRFKDIMAANFNALLDKMEDPEKMIDQYIRNLENDLGEIKSETASVMAEEKAAKRKLDDNEAETAKMQQYAEKAVKSGDDAAAKQFLSKKADLVATHSILEQQYTICCENAAKMREMHDKVCRDLDSLRSRRDMLKAKVKVAETQKKINNLTSNTSKAAGSIAKFDELEEKINKKLDAADAMAELNGSQKENSIEELKEKYDDGAKSAAVDEELAALKASMGISQEGGAQ